MIGFWKDKHVFITGHTGFKGGWLSLWLTSLGAKVTGYGLEQSSEPNLFSTLGLNTVIEKSYIQDVRDLTRLKESVGKARPDILIHMAAQSLVRYSYKNPVETYATNVMGTVNVLESVREVDSVRATLVVTSDKCYENKEWIWGYRENEPMGGHDPYSNSKGCAELVVAAYRQSFFAETSHTVSPRSVATARAGNVIGGGDWSSDRLIPDAIRAFEAKQPLSIRNPLAQRPWQHVLEPLSGYLALAQALFEKGHAFEGGWNFGPEDSDNRSVQEVIELLIRQWGDLAKWRQIDWNPFHEASLLKLDCSKAKSQLAWTPRWNLELAVKRVVEWQRAYQTKQDMQKVTLTQINEYMKALPII